MKRFLFLLLLTVFGGTAGYRAARWKYNGIAASATPAKKIENTCNGFLPSPYTSEKRPFCVIILGKNNGANLEKTVVSVTRQDYAPFRIVYIDDGSEDGSGALAKDVIETSPMAPNIRLIETKQEIRGLDCLQMTIRECSDEEIVLVLNGDEWLAHDWVLQKLNQYYADPDLWLAYGQTVLYPSYGRIEPNRRCFFACPKVFYASLFKKILASDLEWMGESIRRSEEGMYMLPMLQMAGDHFTCLPEVLSITGRNDVISEQKQMQAGWEKTLRSIRAYPEMGSLDWQLAIEEEE